MLREAENYNASMIEFLNHKKIQIKVKMKLITLIKIGESLGYSDLRSVRKWCKTNSVFIIKQGKNEMAAEANFREAYDRPLIKELQQKYGDEWSIIYQQYVNGEIPDKQTLIVDRKPEKSFKPKNELISKYLLKYEKSKAA